MDTVETDQPGVGKWQSWRHMLYGHEDISKGTQHPHKQADCPLLVPALE